MWPNVLTTSTKENVYRFNYSWRMWVFAYMVRFFLFSQARDRVLSGYILDNDIFVPLPPLKFHLNQQTIV